MGQAPASKLGLSAVRATAAPAVRFASAVVMDEVEDKVKGIIAEQLGVEAGSVKPDSSFTEDLGADSLDAQLLSNDALHLVLNLVHDDGRGKAHGRRGGRAHGAHAELAGGCLEGSRRNDAHAENPM